MFVFRKDISENDLLSQNERRLEGASVRAVFLFTNINEMTLNNIPIQSIKKFGVKHYNQ